MSGPLDGVRVIDVSSMLMAPYATQILGDMGADVIKVEAPGGDPVRGVGPMRHPGMGAIFLNANRSKRSIVLDLKQAAGLEAALDLIRGADVVVFNVRPRALDRLGLGYEAVARVNPGVIYASLFGYGQDGPYAARPAFDDLIQGAVAVPWLAHMADGGEPRYAPTAIVDRGVALWAVGQVCAALFRRSRTGEGQRIEIPMFEMMASFVLADHLAGRTFDPPIGPPGYVRMLNPDRRPFRTRDGHVCAMIYTDGHWRSFFRALGREDEFERDPRYATMTARTENIAALYAELAQLLLTRTTAEWMELFERADIPVARMYSMEDILADEHLDAIGFFGRSEHPTEGEITTVSSPVEWIGHEPAPARHAPVIGQDTVEVLRAAGYAQAAIDELLAKGVVVQAPAAHPQ